MGNCGLKSNPNFVVEETRQKDGEKKLSTSIETQATADGSEIVSPLMNARKPSTLIIKQGEEGLFSKKINIDSFEVEKVIGKGAYGKVFLVK